MRGIAPFLAVAMDISIACPYVHYAQEGPLSLVAFLMNSVKAGGPFCK